MVENSQEPVRFRLDLSYDGSDFTGWSRQPGLRTVQGTLEEALETIFRRHPPAPRLVVAGRTDAGVHAAAQVAHVELTRQQLAALVKPSRGHRETAVSSDPEVQLLRRVNGVLGAVSDIVVHRARIAPEGFDARFSAVWRRYEYRIADAVAHRDPLQRHRTYWHHLPLDVEAMDATAASLVGLHDFRAYCKPREGATTIRTLQDFRWRRDEDGTIVAFLQADAFCHSMVRALVGACVSVGEGKLPAQELTRLLEQRERDNEFKVMPARGLTLIRVGYPEDGLLRFRAEQTRARRRLDGEAEAEGAVEPSAADDGTAGSSAAV
ncbi:tRNA pseudouridine(38-40) synthase TruA [Compostimonas suwonensis]